jgi:hypothetical protein
VVHKTPRKNGRHFATSLAPANAQGRCDFKNPGKVVAK